MDEPEKKPKKKKANYVYHKKDDSAPLITHKCADCGAPTPDHRCRKCLAAWRAKHHVIVYNTDE
jgi:recombinational DNA repair protein RecR